MTKVMAFVAFGVTLSHHTMYRYDSVDTKNIYDVLSLIYVGLGLFS